MSTATTERVGSDIQPNVTPADPPGNPMVIGLAGFVVGSVALGLQLSGYVSAAAGAAVLPIIFGSSAAASLIATLWAARLGQNAVAAVFGVFAGFWTSYTLLVMGLTKGWLAIPAEDIAHTQALFVISWLIVVVALTIGSVRLPFSFTLVFALVDLTFVLQLVGVLNANAAALKYSGYSTLGFALIGVYLFLDAFSQATGGRALPIGRPLAAG
jgi:uncharacterized protein